MLQAVAAWRSWARSRCTMKALLERWSSKSAARALAAAFQGWARACISCPLSRILPRLQRCQQRSRLRAWRAAAVRGRLLRAALRRMAGCRARVLASVVLLSWRDACLPHEEILGKVAGGSIRVQRIVLAAWRAWRAAAVSAGALASMRLAATKRTRLGRPRPTLLAVSRLGSQYVSQSASQQIYQSRCQSVCHSVRWSVYCWSVSQPVAHSVTQLISQSVNQSAANPRVPRSGVFAVSQPAAHGVCLLRLAIKNLRV